MKKRNISVIVSAVVICCLILSLMFTRQHRADEVRQAEHHTAVPFGPNPNFKKIGHNQDDAYAALDQKEYQVQMQCNSLRLSDTEVKRRITAVREIGHEELDRVRATGYTQSFNPDVWKQLPFQTDPPK